MGNLTRTSKSTQREQTRVIVVRQPVKSVRAGEQGDPLPIRLAIGAMAVLGGAAVIWLIGYTGFHLGFAPLLGISLDLPPGGGLVAGLRTLFVIPSAVLHAAMLDPMWLLIGFLMIAIPGGGLAAAKPASPGGPQPPALAVVFSFTGAIAAMIASAALFWWVVSSLRGALLMPLPLNGTAIDTWMDSLRLAAALDAMGVIVAALWVVLVARLTVPLWMRVLAACAAYAALVMMILAVAASAGALSQTFINRPIVAGNHPGTRLILGESGGRLVMLAEETPGKAVLRMAAASDDARIFGADSIYAFIRRQRVPLQ
ncbi:MAG TPA: hypothetical protein PK400_04485 [Phycisphaerales bacterium]|nr:hypothetical protein [Phycisphaerales bacterium]HRQ75007.1 hypothetical protein [Phycisphaerales bacterium]